MCGPRFQSPQPAEPARTDHMPTKFRRSGLNQDWTERAGREQAGLETHLFGAVRNDWNIKMTGERGGGLGELSRDGLDGTPVQTLTSEVQRPAGPVFTVQSLEHALPDWEVSRETAGYPAG